MDAALFNRLSTHTGVSALVGTRVYPVVAPQNTAMPYIVYTQTGMSPMSALQTDTNLMRAYYEVACYAESFADAKNLSNQVVLALQRWRGVFASITVEDTSLTGRSDAYSEEARLFASTVDIESLYRT